MFSVVLIWMVLLYGVAGEENYESSRLKKCIQREEEDMGRVAEFLIVYILEMKSLDIVFSNSPVYRK